MPNCAGADLPHPDIDRVRLVLAQAPPGSELAPGDRPLAGFDINGDYVPVVEIFNFVANIALEDSFSKAGDLFCRPPGYQCVLLRAVCPNFAHGRDVATPEGACRLRTLDPVQGLVLKLSVAYIGIVGLGPPATTRSQRAEMRSSTHQRNPMSPRSAPRLRTALRPGGVDHLSGAGPGGSCSPGSDSFRALTSEMATGSTSA